MHNEQINYQNDLENDKNIIKIFNPSEKFLEPIKNFYVNIPQNYLPRYNVNLMIAGSIIAAISFFTFLLMLIQNM